VKEPYRTPPPLDIIPLMMGGGPSWLFLSMPPPLSWHLLINSDPHPALLNTSYDLPPPSSRFMTHVPMLLPLASLLSPLRLPLHPLLGLLVTFLCHVTSTIISMFPLLTNHTPLPLHFDPCFPSHPPLSPPSTWSLSMCCSLLIPHQSPHHVRFSLLHIIT
jgi:hypothetical protein